MKDGVVVHRRAARILREGIEAGEVRQFIDDAHKAIGGAGSTFCIVQFGRSTAFPHGLPGECRLREGDVVLIDSPTGASGPPACGVVDLTGRAVACPGETGLLFVPLAQARHAWRIG